MGCDRLPTPVRAPASVNDRVGDIINVPNACSTYASADSLQSTFMPDNGEYTWLGGNNGCNFCSFDAPVEVSCSIGCADFSCCSLPGVRGSYRKDKYLADPTTCCSTGVTSTGPKPKLITTSLFDEFTGWKTSAGFKTCDPKYIDAGGPACKPYMSEFCKEGDNIFLNTKCGAWCATYPVDCLAIKASYCNNPNTIGTIQCQSFCKYNPGLCDAPMDAWCKLNPAAESCSCINSPIGQYKYNPTCTDAKCVRTGYITAPMQNTRAGGCQITDCSAVFNIVAGGHVDFTDVNVIQNCQTSAAFQQAREASEAASASAQGTATGIKTTVWILVGIAVAIIFILFIYWFMH